MARLDAQIAEQRAAHAAAADEEEVTHPLLSRRARRGRPGGHGYNGDPAADPHTDVEEHSMSAWPFHLVQMLSCVLVGFLLRGYCSRGSKKKAAAAASRGSALRATDV